MKPAVILADPLRARCVRALAAHRTRAKREGKGVLPYRLADLEQLARTATQCNWCRMPVAYDFHFDHVTPTSRGGAHALDNLVVSCSRDNLLKGQLDGPEFMELLHLLARLHPVAAADLTRRLLAGGKRYRSRQG